MTQSTNKLSQFWQELKRRKVGSVVSIYLLIHLVTIGLYAQKVISLTDIEQANESFFDHIEILCDTSDSYDISQIRLGKREGHFSPLSKFSKEISSDYTYWLHFVVEGAVESNVSIGLFIPKENHLVDVYSISDSVLFIQKTGLYVDGIENSEIIPFSNIIQIEEDGITEFYLRIRNTYSELPNFQLEFVNLNAEIKTNNRRVISDAVLQGMLWLMTLYGLFLYFLNRDKIYIFYSLYVFFESVLMMGCFALGYRIMYNLPRSLFVYTDIPNFIAFIFYIKFIRSFINTAMQFPKWDKSLKIIQSSLIVLVIGISIAHYTTNATLIIFVIQNIITWLIMMFFIVLVIRLLFSKNTLAKIIGIGTSLLILGYGVFSVLIVSQNSYYNDTLFTPAKIGIALELIIFTFGISYRYMLIEKEKREYQKKLIVQLNENVELQGKVTRELEDKVKERTVEISHKNELLEQQKEEVEAQRDEIEAQRDQLAKHRDLVVSQKKEITDSIDYAQRIQSALLPQKSYLEKVMPEYFIVFKPKDIVSGDFYWVKEFNSHLIVVGADCTGHGVPGGFMSMLGITLLNDLVGQGSLDQPGEILGQLRLKVKEMLTQEGMLHEQKDGMDMTIAIIDKVSQKLKFAGANNPLYLIRKKIQPIGKDLEKFTSIENQDSQLFEIKGDKQPIGVHWEESEFTTHTIDLHKEDAIYVFSDGIIDQFGGGNRKKYKASNFKKLLLSLQAESMESQKQVIESTFESWRSDCEQIDDVCVIGLRV